MNRVIRHTEYLLRSHDCVVVPGWGAFVAGYRSAHFSATEADTLLPPSRGLAFNGDIAEADGLLARSIARGERCSYDEASRMLQQEVEGMLLQLQADGQLTFGHLGEFVQLPGEPRQFLPSASSPVNARYFGLQPLKLTPVAQDTASEIAEVPTPAALPEQLVVATRQRLRWLRPAAGIAASIAVAVVGAMFLLTPLHVGQMSQAPVVEASAITAAIPAATPPQPRRLTIAPAPEAPIIATQRKPAAAPTLSTGLSADARYFLIVASFPTRRQAEQHLASSPKPLGILEKDGRYRVYAASADSAEALEGAKAANANSQAWICHR